MNKCHPVFGRYVAKWCRLKVTGSTSERSRTNVYIPNPMENCTAVLSLSLFLSNMSRGSQNSHMMQSWHQWLCVTFASLVSNSQFLPWVSGNGKDKLKNLPELVDHIWHARYLSQWSIHGRMLILPLYYWHCKLN